MPDSKSARWAVVSVFALASTWNYLDRLLLSAAKPAVCAEFHLNNAQFGWLIAAFSIAYALASPATGWLLDRLGTEIAMAWAVAIWSAASLLTPLAQSFAQLFGPRIVLGASESVGVPAAGKLNAAYLEPKNRAIGAAMTQVGLSIAGVTAPILVGAMSNWRHPFYVCAALGLIWIPLFLFLRSRVKPYEEAQPARANSAAILKDHRLQILVIANILWMGSYSLWTNWTPAFLTDTYSRTLRQVAPWAAIPPIAATLGGFAGGWISRQAIARGTSPARARVFAALISAIGCLSTALAPLCHTLEAATLAISASSFWAVAGSVNLYTMPIDIWGGEQAGTAISALVFGYGILQTVISPLIGTIVDHHGYGPVCFMLAPLPLVAWALLRAGRDHSL